MENGGNLEGRAQNLELRFASVEQILPTLATKGDLKGMPTVDDPKGFATKDDLERFATKEDLEHEMHSMREFVREQIGFVRTEMASDRVALWRSTLALIEAERERWAVVVDGLNRLGEKVDRVDIEARQRARALERRMEKLEEH